VVSEQPGRAGAENMPSREAPGAADGRASPSGAELSECSGPDCVSAPMQVQAGATAGCQQDGLACSSSGLAIPTRCTAAGVWEELTPCAAPTPFCLRGACVECAAGSVRCSGEGANVPVACSPDGSWQAGAACSGAMSTCLDGACVNLGATCSSGSDCATGACLNGACVECMPQSASCMDNTPRTCSEAGTWVSGSACSGELPRCRAETGSCGPDEWGIQFQRIGVRAIAVGPGGGVFVAGTDGSAGLLRKHDSNGAALWTTRLDEAFSGVNSAARDNNGDVVVVATESLTLNVDIPGSPTNSLLARKYSGETGTEQWRYAYPDPNYSSLVTLDSYDTVLITSFNYPPAFIRLSDTGSVLSRVEVEGLGDSLEPASISTDGAGNLVLAGGRYDPNDGETQAYVAKFAQDGTELWVRIFGTEQTDRAYSVALDDTGGIYVAGTTSGVLAGPATSSIANAFLRKYDSSGTVVWTQQFNETSTPEQYSVAVDGSGNVYLAGQTARALPGQTALGGLDLFVMKFSGDGSLLATRQFGTAADDELSGGVAPSINGTVYVAGTTEGTLPGQTSSGGKDSCLFKLRP
jgi:hypothetical protein